METKMSAWEETCSLMDDRGFLPKHNCKSCKGPLDTTGDRPAELYLGTYTGLCNKCTMAGSFVVKEYRDGALKISYAPHCPSWRRDREEYIAYSDCEICRGTGRLYVSRSMSQGGSYYRYCSQCLNRYSNESLRVWASNRRGIINDAAQTTWEQVLRKNRLIAKAKKGDIPVDRVKELSRPVHEKRERALGRLDKLAEEWGVWG